MVLTRMLPLLSLMAFAAALPAHAVQNGAKPTGEGHGMPDLSNAPPSDRQHLQVSVLMGRCARRQQQMQQNQHIPDSDPRLASLCRKLDSMMDFHHEYELTQPQ